jgi:hypothetical protein
LHDGTTDSSIGGMVIHAGGDDEDTSEVVLGEVRFIGDILLVFGIGRSLRGVCPISFICGNLEVSCSSITRFSRWKIQTWTLSSTTPTSPIGGKT